MPSMKPEIKERWLAALRSGEYEQGRSVLRTPDDKFCCLGVLTDLYLKETGKQWLGNEHTGYGYDGVEGCLHTKVRTWAGFEGISNLGAYGSVSLAQMNDAGVSFSTIASVIERDL